MPQRLSSVPLQKMAHERGSITANLCVSRHLSLFSLTDRPWNQSPWTRAGSEPASNLQHVADTSSSSKRKRPAFSSLSIPDSGGPSQPQRMAEASPNPKPRKQTRRARMGLDVGKFIFFFFGVLIGSLILMPNHVRGRCPERGPSLCECLSGCEEAAPESCSPTREY